MVAITSKRAPEDILDQVTRKYPGREPAVFILGCEGCAAMFNTGGRPQILQLSQYLRPHVRVTGTAGVTCVCFAEFTKAVLHRNRKRVLESDAIIALSCGGGVMAVRQAVENIDVIPGLITLGVGPWLSDSPLFVDGGVAGNFNSPICRACSQPCVTDGTFGLCPYNLCPQHRKTSPCPANESLDSETCVVESNSENRCVWWEINRLQEQQSRFRGSKQLAPRNARKLVGILQSSWRLRSFGIDFFKKLTGPREEKS